MKLSAIILTLAVSLQTHANIVVAVIDTGYDRITPAPLCHDANPYPDRNPDKHGTNVVGLITQNAGLSGYCMYPFSAFNRDSSFNFDGYLNILRLLTRMHIDVLNLSLQGHQYSREEVILLKKLLDQGVIIFASAGNHSEALYEDHCGVYPACDDDRITVVGTYDETSAKGSRVDIKTHRSSGCAGGVCLTGTSQATAIETGRFIRRLVDHK